MKRTLAVREAAFDTEAGTLDMTVDRQQYRFLLGLEALWLLHEATGRYLHARHRELLTEGATR